MGLFRVYRLEQIQLFQYWQQLGNAAGEEDDADYLKNLVQGSPVFHSDF